MTEPLNLIIPMTREEREKLEALAHRRGLVDLSAYVRELLDADYRHTQITEVLEQLSSAGLLVEDLDILDQEIAALAAQGYSPLQEPLTLPANGRSTEDLLNEDRHEEN